MEIFCTWKGLQDRRWVIYCISVLSLSYQHIHTPLLYSIGYVAALCWLRYRGTFVIETNLVPLPCLKGDRGSPGPVGPSVSVWTFLSKISTLMQLNRFSLKMYILFTSFSSQLTLSFISWFFVVGPVWACWIKGWIWNAWKTCKYFLGVLLWYIFI